MYGSLAYVPCLWSRSGLFEGEGPNAVCSPLAGVRAALTRNSPLFAYEGAGEKAAMRILATRKGAASPAGCGKPAPRHTNDQEKDSPSARSPR